MKPQLREVQALRGIAFLAVLLFHSSGTMFENGYLGVDIFFVISGFVITPQLYKIFERPSLRRNLLEFYLRRIYRLFPALYVVIFVSLPLILFLGDVRDLASVWNQSITSLLFLGNILPIFSQNGYHEQALNPYLHTWSLGVEFQIYLVLPVLIYLLIKKVNFHKILFFSCFLSFVSFAALELFFQQTSHQITENMGFYTPITRFWEFGLGALLSTLNYSKQNQKSAKIRLRPILYLSFGLILFINLFNFDKNVSLVSVLCVSVFFLLAKSEVTGGITIISALAWLGDRSYSLYLVHLPLLYIAKYSPVFTNIFTSEIRTTFAVFLSIVLGVILYETIENRFRKNFIGYDSKKHFFRDLLIITSICLLTFTSFFPMNKTVYPINPLESLNSKRNTEWDKNCALEMRSEPCVYNQGQEKSLLLIGDSHAAMFGKTMVDLGFETNLTIYIWAAAACQYFLPGSTKLNSPTNDPCIMYNQLRRSWVIENKPDFVVFSIIDSKLNYEKYFHSNEIFLSSIVESMQYLSSYTRHQAFIMPTPKLPHFSLLQFLKNNRMFPVTEEYFLENVLWRDKLSSTQFSLIETQNELCPNSVCIPIVDGKKIWEDTTHISYYGSNLIKGQLKEFINNE